MAQSWNRTVDDGFVDMEQIIKRLEWLDNERRKDKSRITALENRITDLNTNQSLLQYHPPHAHERKEDHGNGHAGGISGP